MTGHACRGSVRRMTAFPALQLASIGFSCFLGSWTSKPQPPTPAYAVPLGSDAQSRSQRHPRCSTQRHDHCHTSLASSCALPASEQHHWPKAVRPAGQVLRHSALGSAWAVMQPPAARAAAACTLCQVEAHRAWRRLPAAHAAAA